MKISWKWGKTDTKHKQCLGSLGRIYFQIHFKGLKTFIKKTLIVRIGKLTINRNFLQIEMFKILTKFLTLEDRKHKSL